MFLELLGLKREKSVELGGGISPVYDCPRNSIILPSERYDDSSQPIGNSRSFGFFCVFQSEF